MHDVIEGADVGPPVAIKLAEIILADIARHGARRLDHVADGAGLYGVGSQLIDHGRCPQISLPPNFFTTGSAALHRSPQERGAGEKEPYSAACAFTSADT